MLKVLLKKQLTEIFRGHYYDAKKNTGRSRGAVIGRFIAYFVVMGGVLGATRAVIDNGWLSADHQVGQTGKTVRPKIYIALGISGAIQHKSGMQDSECIIAVNKAENAPIFEIADYGIVGDLFDVTPKLIEEIRKAKQ